MRSTCASCVHLGSCWILLIFWYVWLDLICIDCPLTMTTKSNSLLWGIYFIWALWSATSLQSVWRRRIWLTGHRRNWAGHVFLQHHSLQVHSGSYVKRHDLVTQSVMWFMYIYVPWAQLPSSGCPTHISSGFIFGGIWKRGRIIIRCHRNNVRYIVSGKETQLNTALQ